MMTRPIAITRGVITCLTVALVGSIALAGLLRVIDVEPTIGDLDGEASRANIVWWGARAFVGCLAMLLGVTSGAMALTSGNLVTPVRALLTVATPLILAWMLTLLLLREAGIATHESIFPTSIGALIGLCGAIAFVVQRGAPRATRDWPRPPQRDVGRSWGSR